MGKTVSEILNAAADLIEPEGAWTKKAFVRNKGGASASECEGWPRGKLCFCALGAVSRANGDRYVAATSFGPFVEALGFARGCDVADWNDAPERTQAEVVAKLREAAALALQEGK